MKRMKCYIYTRVSTSMQVDGYSLDAQTDKLRKYAEFQNMLVVGEYCDEGKSGKNIEGRPEFLRMLRDIEAGKDGISFVLVFKLSRFGRNAADVLTSLQRMQDFGVNLICVEDGIDSSKDSGKLMISVLSAVAEIERENILVQTMEGRRQKAREGKWNGGFAPYGYKLVDGQLQIAEEEAEVIRIIYDKYIHTTMGTARIANWLNEHGYSKICRHNNKREAFTGSFLIGVLDNPVYCGKLAYGRRHNEKIPGTRNQYHIVKQKDYALYDGIHEPIISEEDWQLAQKQRQQTNQAPAQDTQPQPRARPVRAAQVPHLRQRHVRQREPQEEGRRNLLPRLLLLRLQAPPACGRQALRLSSPMGRGNHRRRCGGDHPQTGQHPRL